MDIHQFAVVHPDAKIGENVKIGPFVTIDANVEIGDGTIIDSGAVVRSGARIGKNCHIHANAVVGDIPQDLKFQGEDTVAIIGDNTVIREFATIHRGTASRGKTVVGNNCLIMAYSHVAHDCVVGNHVIMSNAVQLAGEVEVADWAIIAGGALMGVVAALLRFVGFNPVNAEWLANPLSEICSIIAYLLLIIYLVRASIKAKNS